MTDEKRRGLACFLKRQLKLDGRDAQCCLPPETWNSTCAFVGNSGVLLSGAFGKDIDRHPFAIRMNNAPVRGYEKYVGSKLSIRGGWNTHPKHRRRDAVDNAETYVYCNDSGQIGKHAKMLRQFPAIKLGPMECDEKRVDRILRTLYPNRLGTLGSLMKLSSGGQVMFAAMQSCTEVHIYGVFPTDKNTAHHYFGDFSSAPLPDTGHAFWAAEHDLWARLSATPLAKIHASGKAVIPGLRGLTGCSEAHAEHAAFKTPYYVLPAHRDSWRKDISNFHKTHAKHDAKVAKESEKKRKKEAKEREKKRKKAEEKKRKHADGQRGTQPQPKPRPAGTEPQPAGTEPQPQLQPQPQPRGAEPQPQPQPRPPSATASAPRAPPGAEPQPQVTAEPTISEPPQGSGGMEERPAMVAAQATDASGSAAEAKHPAESARAGPSEAPPGLDLSAASLPFLANATLPGLQRPLESRAEWAVAVVGGSSCCLFSLAMCKRALGRRIGMLILSAATLVGSGLLSTAFVDPSVTWARWSLATKAP